MKRTITLSLLAAAGLLAMAQQPWMDASLSFHERAKLLVQQMTLSEKINQVGHGTFPVSRLGLNGYYYWNEGLHGVARSGPATSFPVSKAMSATWDEQLVFQCASATADEARVYNNVYGKGLIYWCPTINMSRDPRWGRDEENYGEDPFLTGRIAVAYIKGMQGDDPKYYKTVATVKHFVANNYEGGRHHTSSNMDERDLREYYLPAYERSVKEGHVRAIMPGYNAVNGVPACCNRKLLKDILRTEWGFDGCVTSDCDALDDIYLAHKYVATGVRAAAISMRNGCDLNCGYTFQAHCEEAIDQGLLTEAELDSALVRVLESRFSVGEFDGPELVSWQQTPDSLLNCHRNRQLALQAAREAIVLLKNDAMAEGEKPLLPLRRDQTVCVIGPLARTITLGGYSGSPVWRTTVLQGIAAKMGVSPRGRNLEFEDVDSMKPCGPDHLLFEANGADGNLGFINSGDWVMFRDVDFGEGKTKLTLRSASPNSGVCVSASVWTSAPVPPCSAWSSSPRAATASTMSRPSTSTPRCSRASTACSSSSTSAVPSMAPTWTGAASGTRATATHCRPTARSSTPAAAT